jgi:hypothetical protein
MPEIASPRRLKPPFDIEQNPPPVGIDMVRNRP